MDSATRAPAESPARLPADTAISRVYLRVADLERSLGFYRDLLGFRVLREQGGRVGLGPRDSERQLIVLEEHPGLARRPRRPVTTGLYHVALLLPGRSELGRALLGLTAAGYPLRGTADHAVSEALYLDDPDGNGLEIYADRPKASWPMRDGVVQMTVDPMDVEGVMAAAGPSEAAWTGLPFQTVVGHVHFTVSDLPRSLAFYCDVVGFDPMMRMPGLAAVSAGGYHHHLNLNTWAGEGAPRDSARVAGLVAWALRVPELMNRKALVDRLAAAGALTPEGAALDPDAIPLLIEELP